MQLLWFKDMAHSTYQDSSSKDSGGEQIARVGSNHLLSMSENTETLPGIKVGKTGNLNPHLCES